MSLPLLVGSCASDPDATAPPLRSAAADKNRLFGDPGLVPTREGERARTELARAGEIERAIRILPGVEDVGVDVELGADATLQSAVVVIRTSSDTAERNQEAAQRIVRGVLGPEGLAATEIVVKSPPAPETLGPTGVPTLPLALALLGLGVSAGITLERGRRLWIRRHGRRRRRTRA